MVGSCRCLKENLDELRIDHRLAISIGTGAPVLACEVID